MSVYPGQQVVYQCDHQAAQSMKQHKDKMHQALQTSVNRKVRIHTMDEEVLEGVLIGFDKNFVYLSVEQAPARAFFPGYYPPRPPFVPYNPILPLALFNLLTISLLY